MTDQLFLSIWLEQTGRTGRLKSFESLLRLFPFSQREQPQSTISVHAIDTTEPPLLERAVNGPIDIDDVLTSFQDYHDSDIAYRVESWWDLWQFDGDWKLAPTRIALSCFGVDFDNGTERDPGDQEDLRIDFGVDAHFLPQPEVPGSARLVESNIKSLLRLVSEVESFLPIARRRLETETGENLAERLSKLLSGASQIQ